MLNKASIEGLRRFLKHADSLKPQNNPRQENGFAKEFQEIKDLSSKLKKDKAFSTYHGEKDVNRPKNRYRDILPYDYSRIILPTEEGVEGSDYINGNYIKGPAEEVSYLAVQGPLPVTVDDFWKMILAHQTQVIVMACREYELGKLKCKRYWPEKSDEILTFGSCKVSLVSQEEMGEGFVIRTLSAKHPKGEHKVTQFHYTAWPDHDVPRSATPLIELTMSFRAFAGNENNVPVLIHCSAGCGRTGTICALDYALNLIKLGSTESFSVYDIVWTLRRQRIAMVQTKEQYELVYKAVKEIVSNELLKQRASMHTYVNVAVGEEMPDAENTYENVEFIRSIQRLHEEEKNAVRKSRELPSKAIVVSPKKDIALIQDTKPLTLRNQAEPVGNHLQGKTANQNTEMKQKDTVPKSTTKPPLKKKPPSGYENVLPLGVVNSAPKPPQNVTNNGPKPPISIVSNTSKPSVVPKPQNYVNVDIQNSKVHDDDTAYVNVPASATKSVPVPEKKVEPKPVPVPSSTKPAKPIKPVPPHPGYQRAVSANGDYVIPPLPKKEDKNSGYVILPNFTTKNGNINQVPEGNLIDVFDSGPTSLPLDLRRSSLNHQGLSDNKINSLDPVLMADLSRSTPSLDLSNQQTNTKQAKTTQRLSGQYSLVGALESPTSPIPSNDRDPFENVPQIRKNVPDVKNRSSFGTVESVVADSGQVKLDKPVIAPRRSSEPVTKSYVNKASLLEGVNSTTSQGGGNSPLPLPQGKSIVGSYSLVTIPNNNENNEKNELLVDLSESSKDSTSSGRSTPTRPVQKSYSTDNIISDKNELYSKVDKSKGASTDALSTANSDYSLVSVPFARRASEEVLSSRSPSLYSRANREVTAKSVDDMSLEERKESVDVLGNGYVRKKPAAVRRSNSGVTPSTVNYAIKDDSDSLYATVGAKTRNKRRPPPMSTDIWQNDTSPGSSLERTLHSANNSSSSLKSVSSTSSSNDSQEDAPPVPLKTSDAFSYPDDDDAYEAVHRSSSSRSTLGRFKDKAKNMMVSGPSKLSLGKKSSPLAASSDSLTSYGEFQSLHIADKGYGSRVAKPSGPRDCPSVWPKFAK